MLTIMLASFAFAADFDVTVEVTSLNGRSILPVVHRVASSAPQVIPMLWRGQPVAGLLASDGSQVCLAFFDANGDPLRDLGGPGCTRPGSATGADGVITSSKAVIKTTTVARP